MHAIPKTIAWVGTAVAAGATAATVGAAKYWTRETNRAVEHLRHAPGETVQPHRLADVPTPVARYFGLVLPPDAPRAIRARLTQEGTFRSLPKETWLPFTAVHHVAAQPPGFVWDARIRMAPLLAVRVRDAYVAGAGAMTARIQGLIPVVDQRGTPEITAGALHRFLAEGPWLPASLLPRPGLRWEAIDAASARAVLTDAGTTVSIEFSFNERGEIVRTYTPARYRDVDGTPVPTPWEGRFGRYERVGGVAIPTEGEVAWILPDGRAPYWRGRITHARFEST